MVVERAGGSGKVFSYKAETSGELTSWGDPSVDRLTRWVARSAHQVVEALTHKSLAAAYTESLQSEAGAAGVGGEQEARVGVAVSRSWASLYRPGDDHEAHFHPNTALAAIYYVTAPKTCELDLLDPRPYVDYFDSGISLAGDRHRVRISCLPGELVIFPGWLRHAVPPYTDDGERISLSWNLNYAVHR
ncbi:TIGR02466 family protein [Streptomyces atratus]|uniref:TIGR02466 family protein n=1 Tax=Streptomyces atratus TaxID=1893 RepID=UPI0036D04625